MRRQLRDLPEPGDYAYGFTLDEAPEVLGVRTAEQARVTLGLMRDAGDLLLHGSAARSDRLTRWVRLPDGSRRRLVVVRGRGDRLGVERLGRGRRWDARQRGERPFRRD